MRIRCGITHFAALDDWLPLEVGPLDKDDRIFRVKGKSGEN
jgi:hypothetical protein